MAIAATADFDQLVFTVEFTTSSGTYTKVCGLTDFSVSRTNNTDTTEVPDCTDESLPYYLKRSVRSQDTTISGTATWALDAWPNVEDWFRSGATKNVRITHAKVTADGSTGDPEIEEIPMILASLSTGRVKGQMVDMEMEMQQNGVVTVTDKA